MARTSSDTENQRKGCPHPAASTRAALHGILHVPTWKSLHTKPGLAKTATLAAQAMHGHAPHCPYAVTHTGGVTPQSKNIRERLAHAKSIESPYQTDLIHKSLQPLSPSLRTGCPYCNKKGVYANAAHYASGACNSEQINPHMTTAFNTQIAAWIISQGYPYAWTQPPQTIRSTQTAHYTAIELRDTALKLGLISTEDDQCPLLPQEIYIKDPTHMQPQAASHTQ